MDNGKREKNKNERNGNGLSLGLCIGIAIGTAIGAATKNIGLWMPIGLSLGLCCGLIMDRRGGEEKCEDQKEEAEDAKQENREGMEE